MRLGPILVVAAVCLAFAPSASAACPIANPDCLPGGGGDPEFGTLAVSASTSPAATSGSPAWDDENLTYTVTVTNDDQFNDATNVTVGADIGLGSANFVSSSASQGSCTGMSCSIGTIPAGASRTMTLVLRPSAGTLRVTFTADSTEMGSATAIKTSTIRSAAASAAIDWTMPERARDLNGDSRIDSGPPPGGYTPSSWSVTLNACASTGGRRSISTYKWEVQGLPEQVTSGCTHTVTVPREQVYPTKLTVTLSDGSTVVANRDVKVVDRFIVMMGDSYASGEGTPHSFIQYGSDSVLAWPTWDDTRCHRSMWASSARAARMLETADPRSSVTYLSRACSGATIAQGILGGYKGIEPVGETLLDPQLKQVRDIVGNARIDNLLISIGGNDAGFATIIADCMLPGDCFSNTTLVNNFNTSIAGLNTSHYPAMREAIEHPATGLNVDSTFITEYPDFTTDANGNRCDAIGADILWPLSINKNEADWASNTVLATITSTLQNQVNAARGAGLDWNYVGGVQAAWSTLGQHGHGYCVGEADVRDPNRWVRTFMDSCDLQGPPAGYNFGQYYCHADKTAGHFHPNEAGYLAIGHRYVAALSPKSPALDPIPDPGGDTGGDDTGGDDTGGDDTGGDDTGGDDTGGDDTGGDDTGGDDTGGDTGGDDPLPDLPNGNPTIGGNLPVNTPVLGGTPSPGTPVVAKKPGKCSKLKGRKRARCIKKACARHRAKAKRAKTRKARRAYVLKYRSCVKAVTRKG